MTRCLILDKKFLDHRIIFTFKIKFGITIIVIWGSFMTKKHISPQNNL